MYSTPGDRAVYYQEKKNLIYNSFIANFHGLYQNKEKQRVL